MTFGFPLAFLLLLLVPLLPWLRRRGGVRKRRASIRFSWTRNASRAGRSWRQKLGALPTVLRLLAIVLLVTAIARPQKGLEQVRDVNKGIAIEMVVDRSSSMGAEMVFEQQRSNRLEIVKKVFAQFVLGNGRNLDGRPNDLVGMVSFARYAETTCPLTLAHGALPRFLETVKLAHPRSGEDGTALGDAIALAAARLEKAEEAMARQAPDREDNYELKSKVMILLTDGRQTAGKRSPLEAAQLAKEWGIKIYTIAVGSEEAVMRRDTLFGQFLQGARGQDADTRTLEAVASETGGRFFEAQNAEALGEIYREIDELERSQIESLRFMDYKELFLPFALGAFLLLGVEVVLSCTIFRKIP
ncbi:MAG: VWA domain-containing protein [Akkermansiaceae bacterium]|nr:VWA domain-containing protein [Akkermansiaceae bacterium]